MNVSEMQSMSSHLRRMRTTYGLPAKYEGHRVAVGDTHPPLVARSVPTRLRRANTGKEETGESP